jgi:hypothetical protein
MKRLIVVFYLMSISFLMNAQNIHFLKSYGNSGYDYGRDIKQTPDSGYIATGSSSSFVGANADLFLLKIDSLGNFNWSYNYGGSDSDWGNSLVITHDSTYAVAGYTNSFGAGGFDFYLVRAAEFGLPMWEKTYGGSDWDKANSLAQIPADSGFVLVGETFSYGAGGKDIYIVRTDKNGDTLWTKTYGDADDDWATGVIVDGDSIVVCGGTESYGAGMSDGIILKMDLDGNIGWVKVVGMEYDDYFNSIVKYATYYMAGGARSYDYPTDKKDMWVYKSTLNGNQLMDTNYSDCPDDDEVYDLYVRNGNEDIIIAGYTKTWGVLDGFGDAFISKFTSSYGFVTSVHYGSAGSDRAYAIDPTFDDGWVIIGDMSFLSTGGNNIFILKYNQYWDHIDIFTELQVDNITLSVENSQGQAGTNFVKLYPNPTNQTLNIESELNIDGLVIVDMTGKIVYTEVLPGSSIDLANLTAGIYTLILSTAESKQTYRVIIQ